MPNQPIFACLAISHYNLYPPIHTSNLWRVCCLGAGDGRAVCLLPCCAWALTSDDAAQFLVHIAKKLETLHAAGWVHRDIKPGNTIWLPSQNAWALIDFGCACETGRHAEISFSVYYAPPEIIKAYTAGNSSIVADPSADVWSLGVR
jgi:serine/threonine protein kinase